MKRCIELISIAIIFIAIAGSFGSYIIGTTASDVAAQDDHGGDDGSGSDDDGGGDAGAESFDDGGGDHDVDGSGSGGSGGGESIDDGGGDHVAHDESTAHLDDGSGDLDSSGGEYVVPDCYECGRYIDPACPLCGGYVQGDPTFVPGPKALDPATGLWYVFPAAGTDYDPSAYVEFHHSSSERGHFDQSGDKPFDVDTTQFLDVTTNTLVKPDALQFFDTDTGALIDPDSAQLSGGGFDYEFRTDAALTAYEDAAAISPDDFAGQLDLTIDLAGNLDFRGFQDLGPAATFKMYDAMGTDEFLKLESGQIAGILNTFESSQYEELGGAQIFEAAKQMQRDDFTGMGAGQASLMFDTMGLDQSLGLETAVFAGMVSRFDPAQFQQIGGENVVQVVGALTKSDLAGLRNEQALGIAATFDVEQIGTLETAQLSGLTTALAANDIGTLGSDIVTVIAGNIGVGDLVALDTALAGSIMKRVPDGALNAFATDRIEATLAALDADFLGAGAADFSNIADRVTTFDQVSFETPPVLLDLLADESAGNIFSGLFGSG
jgi:hypothetical protein